MKPISPEYLNQPHTVKPGDRLHRLVSRLFDTYYDDLTEENIEELERKVDECRWMQADAKRF